METDKKKENLLIPVVIVLFFLILIIIVIWRSSLYSGETGYERCIRELSINDSEDSAQNEPIGATRSDSQGNIWTKTEEGWIIEEKNLRGEEICIDSNINKKSCGFVGNYMYRNMVWADEVVDRETSGTDYSNCK